MNSFRFCVTLNAPTAMVKRPDEIPITYLNKCQTYTISIADTLSAHANPGSTRYRTFVRISFEDETQRARPAACWQLWKEGRGINEAHQRGGRLQAVEYVSPQHHADDRPSNVELVKAAFDGFCVVWYPNHNGIAECSVSVRFNFLSTDFSHSKGVKGIPVRLCAKTEILDPSYMAAPVAQEVAYCKVKLFRDHGAERKLSNDISHIKKSIDKINQQIAQGDAPVKENGKRKRSDSASRANNNKKRAWSVSSGESGREPSDDDLHAKLAIYQAMFTSTRPSSVLFLRGEEKDDPEFHPIHLPGQASDLTTVETLARVPMLQKSSTANTSNTTLTSPSPSSGSISSPQHHLSFGRGAALPSSERSSHMHRSVSASELQHSHSRHRSISTDVPVKVRKHQSRSRSQETNEWMESVDVDPSYRAPSEVDEKPGMRRHSPMPPVVSRLIVFF